jgi:serine/threonine protein kinase
MNAEALVGKKLGSYTLRRVIGVGSMGAVYLARPPRSQREYVLKVFLHASSLEPLQYIDFILRFRQEMSLVASLQHPHIISVLEYEERDGFVYLVMPYASGRSLESLLNSQKLLSLPMIADYLDQLAGALDYAHEHEVLHLDIKPSNILVTIDDKLLFTDFALAKTMTERQAARIRQFKVGMLDYMAPEQVMGTEPGEKADIYSLGAVLYHMVTGCAPFTGESLVEVAKKHLQEAPLSPRSKREDLPLAAEQVILRALSKQRGHRYAHAQDLATAFRVAVETSSTDLEQQRKDKLLSSDGNSSGVYPSYSLFDPQWRTEFSPIKENQPALSQTTPALTAADSAMPPDASVSVKDPTLPPKPEPVAEKSSHMLRAVHFNPITPVLETRIHAEQNANQSRILTVPEAEQKTTGTIMKLTSPAKVVNVPVAGQPGHYLVGLLPVRKKSEPEKVEQPAVWGRTIDLKNNSKIIGLALLVVLLLGTVALWFAHQVSSSKTPAPVTVVKTPDLKATMAVRATATAEANIILSDPLTTNIHNWPLMATGSMLYTFKDNAYHITDNDNSRGAPAVLSGLILQGPFVYSLTMEEIKGDDTSVNNQFGMIFRATIQSKGGATFTTFYSLEVLNKTGGEYQFWKYDNSQRSGGHFWKKLGSHHFGDEFYVGHGPKSINTFKIIANGKNYTLIVNGKKAWTFQDGSFTSGGIGMLVNLKGTEVAFSNLLLTHN